MFKEIWWFIRGSLIEFGNILILLVISYLTTIINVFIIAGIKNMDLLSILKREDILNTILTASISMLAGIFVIELSKKHTKKLQSLIILGNCLLAVVISLILTIQIEKGETFFNLKLIYGGAVLFFGVSLILVFTANYKLINVKEYMVIQRAANQSRNEDKVKIDGAEYEL